MPAPMETMDFPTLPRVTPKSLRGFVGQDVRFVGEVVSVDTGSGMAILSTPIGQVTVQKHPESQYSRFVEIEGKVVTEELIEEYASTNYGDEGFDMNTYTQAVELALQHTDIF